MMTVTIKISGLENLTAAINSLAAAGGVQGEGTALQPGPVQQMPVQQPPVQQMPGPIPTTAVPQEYTQDQLAVAMTGLVERGMQPQVMGILSAMGCQTLLQVPKERYPELVLKLREAGAVI